MVSRTARQRNRQRTNVAVAAAVRAAAMAAPRRTVVVQAPMTPARRARRRRYRQRRRMRQRQLEQIAIGGGVSDLGSAPTYAPEMGVALAPNENYEPASVAMTDSAMPIPEMAMLGSTLNGQRWALKALHPNGAGVTASVGIPDHTHVPVTTPEFRQNFVISHTDTSENWDVDILFLGTPDIAFLYRTYAAGGTPSDDGGWRAIYYAASQPRIAEFNMLGWKDDGTGVRFAANLQSGSAGVQYPKARGMYAGMTITFDAPALADQGRLVAAQLPLTEQPTVDGVEMQLSDGAYQFVETRVVNLGRMPLTEDELFQASPGAVVWEAREGVYIPLRFNEPVHLFRELKSGNIAIEGNSNTSPPNVLGYVRERDNKLISLRPNLAAKQNFATEGVLNFLTGVVLFRGIDGRANLSVKTRMGIEAQVERGSVIAPYQHASPGLDRQAIDVVTEVAQRSAMAYPAHYNNTNKLMDALRSILSTIKMVGGAVSGLGIPYVSAIGGGASSILGGLGFAPMRSANRLRNAVARRLAFSSMR